MTEKITLEDGTEIEEGSPAHRAIIEAEQGPSAQEVLGHRATLGEVHLAQLDGYEPWQAEEALHAWAAHAAEEAQRHGRDDLAEALCLHGVTAPDRIRQAFEERVAALKAAGA